MPQNVLAYFSPDIVKKLTDDNKDHQLKIFKNFHLAGASPQTRKT